MDFMQRMKRALQRGRSASLPPDDNDAAYVLLPFVMQNQIKPFSDLIANSTFDIDHQFGRARRTLLHAAANTGAADCVGFLLKRNAKVDLQDKIGVTPLHLAARNGHKKCVQKLMEAGADITIHDNEGLTALHWVACNGRTALLVSILEHGEYVDVTDAHGHTALHDACQNGHYQCVVQLLDHKADIHRTSNNGGTPLYYACKHGQLRCVKLLLQRGAGTDPDKDGVSPLQLCVQSGYVECAEIILKYFPNAVDHMIHLVFDETFPEDKILATMEYLCNSGAVLLGSVVTRLADRNCMAGMELLSVSSSYKDLMPQFLRGIRVLSVLYKYYASATDVEVSSSLSPLSVSVPASPLTADSTTDQPANVRRTGSFGSLLDSPRSRGRSVLHFAGHRRSHSQTLSPNNGSTADQDDPFTAPARAQSTTLPLSSSSHRRRAKSSNRRSPSEVSISNPFDRLEIVWSSLESWFDLLVVKVERSQQQQDPAEGTEADNGETKSPSPKQITPGISVMGPPSSLPSDASPQPDSLNSPSTSPKRKPNLQPIPAQQPPMELAAAIVNSVPLQRRTVYLKTSSSFGDKPLSSCSSRALKTRSWHVERVTARYLTAIGDSLISSPRFDRSLSSDTTINEPTVLPGSVSPLLESQAAPQRTPGTQGEEEVREKSRAGATRGSNQDETWKPDIVGAYADRLCAVTHAFGLCCNTIQKASGSPGDVLPRFLEFINKYESVLKVLLARNPKLIFEHFHFLLENTELLDRFMHIVHVQPFEDRKKWFYENLYHGRPPSNELSLAAETNSILIDREEIFTTSCVRIAEAPVEALRDNLTIQFRGEAGMGSGVRREWFDSLSREILNPDYALFTQSTDGATFQPNSHSDVNPDHLSYFKFAGRMMALALYHQQLLNVYFTRSFYKHILGIPPNYKDVESIDPEYANNLQWLLDHEIDALELELTFSVETDVFGASEVIELISQGSAVTVTDRNKRDYVQLVTEMRMTHAIGHQIRSFLDGFYEVVPHALISLFDEYELELLLSGLPEIDVDDWQRNTEYSGYDEVSPIVQWYWEIVHGFDKKTLAVLLQFVTGSSRVPLGGFANLVGATGLTKFTVSRVECSPSRLPMASTCFNLLKLPEYPSKAVLKERLNIALTCGTGLIDIT